MTAACANCGKVADLVRFEGDAREPICCGCWNAEVYERRAARKAELAAEPRCEGCGKGRQTWNLTGVGVCGRCKTKAERAWTRKAVLDLLQPAVQGSLL